MKVLVVVYDDAMIPNPQAANDAPGGTPARSGLRGWMAVPTIRHFSAIASSPALRWLAIPMFAIPAVIGGYCMVQHVLQEAGVLPPVCGHILAALTGSVSGLTTIARLGLLPQLGGAAK